MKPAMKSSVHWSEEDYLAMAYAITDARIADGSPHVGISYAKVDIDRLIERLKNYGTESTWDRSRSATGIPEVIRCPKDDALLHINVDGTAVRALAAWRLANGR